MEIETETEMEMGVERGKKRLRDREIAWLFLTRSLFKFYPHDMPNHSLALLNLMKPNVFIKLCLSFSSNSSDIYFCSRRQVG